MKVQSQNVQHQTIRSANLDQGF